MISDSVLVVAAGGVVRGLDRNTGQELWKNGLSGGGYGEVAIHIEGDLIVASAAGAMAFGLSYPSGEQLWASKTTAMGRATVWIDARQLVIAKGGYLDCFD